jgi:F420-dependent hydroxymycolic acid dehydrogenase
MLPHEEFTVPDLVRFGVAAEQAGFDFLATSDHFQPWQDNQGHAGFAWVTMAAVGEKTNRVWIGTTVTCSTYRYSPAVVAQGFASLATLHPNRIFLGVGSGEALNEQAAIGQWDPWPVRSERLIGATKVIRELWKGGEVTHKGRHYDVRAKLYDVPPARIPVRMAANGPKAMAPAAIHGDGLVTDPKTWRQHGSALSGLKEAGRDPSSVPVPVETYAVVGGETERDEAVQPWRLWT